VELGWLDAMPGLSELAARKMFARPAVDGEDRIFTRVGASDVLVRGMSTFMVEMIEALTILQEMKGIVNKDEE
jgi:hypothetical protein